MRVRQGEQLLFGREYYEQIPLELRAKVILDDYFGRSGSLPSHGFDVEFHQLIPIPYSANVLFVEEIDPSTSRVTGTVYPTLCAFDITRHSRPEHEQNAKECEFCKEIGLWGHKPLGVK